MASVRMTHELRDKIFRSAENAYETANPEPKPNNELIELTKKVIYNSPKQRFLREMKAKAEELGIPGMEDGGTYMPVEKNDIAEVEVKQRNNNPNTRNTWEGFALRFSTPISMLKAPNDRSWYSPNIHVTDAAPEDLTEFAEKAGDLCKTRTEYWDNKRTYEQSIRELLSKCNTLKQLLEVWPAAESLVPAEKLQQMHVKVTRAERAKTIKEEVSFDPTVANQTVLTAKLMGG